MAEQQPRRIIIGITGASIEQYAIRLVEVLATRPDIETHLVISDVAKQVMRLEMGYGEAEIEALQAKAYRCYDNHDSGAAIASGSYKTDGMIVIPCSVKTLSHIAHGSDDSLIDRAAFCTLKEGRKLVLVPRETPAPLSYLRNLVAASENGATVLLPVPAFYHRPKTIGQIIDQTVQKVLDQFGIEMDLFQRWQ